MATAKNTKRRRQRIDTLIDAHVWLRKMANKKVPPHNHRVCYAAILLR